MMNLPSLQRLTLATTLSLTLYTLPPTLHAHTSPLAQHMQLDQAIRA